MKKPRVYIRTDSNRRIGFGHASRMMILAAELTVRDYDIHFIVQGGANARFESVLSQSYESSRIHCEYSSDEAIDDKNRNSVGSSIEFDAEQTNAHIDGTTPHILIFDHYGLDREWSNLVRNPNTLFQIQFDDIDNKPIGADILVDMATPSLESRRFRTNENHVGLDYVLMNPKICEVSNYSERRKFGLRVAVSAGLYDPAHICYFVAEALRGSVCEPHFFIGSGYSRLDDLKELVIDTGGFLHLDQIEIWRRFFDFDFAICSGGMTALECCYLGLPSLNLAASDAQVPFCHYLQEVGASIHIPEKCARTLLQGIQRLEDNYDSLSRKGASLIDAKGAARVVDIIDSKVREF